MANRHLTKWFVGYTIPGTPRYFKKYFNTREEADGFEKELSEDYMTVVYPVDEEGKPIFDTLSNFNLK